MSSRASQSANQSRPSCQRGDSQSLSPLISTRGSLRHRSASSELDGTVLKIRTGLSSTVHRYACRTSRRTKADRRASVRRSSRRRRRPSCATAMPARAWTRSPHAAAVSKQTVYKHFADKERLFSEIVTSHGRRGQRPRPREVVTSLQDSGDIETDLRDLARRQLAMVMQPRLMQLRRLVIARGRPVSRTRTHVLRTRPGPDDRGARDCVRAPRRARRPAARRPAARGSAVQLAGHVDPAERGDVPRQTIALQHRANSTGTRTQASGSSSPHTARPANGLDAVALPDASAEIDALRHEVSILRHRGGNGNFGSSQQSSSLSTRSTQFRRSRQYPGHPEHQTLLARHSRGRRHQEQGGGRVRTPMVELGIPSLDVGPVKERSPLDDLTFEIRRRRVEVSATEGTGRPVPSAETIY